MPTSRREFLQISVVLGGAAALGCSSSTPSGTDAGTPGTDAPTGGTDAPAVETDAGPFVCATVTPTIMGNHGHVLDVPLADVTAATDKTYDIMGTSLHTHMVTVTAANFATIAAGGTVMVTSSTASAHSHMITVVCSAA